MAGSSSQAIRDGPWPFEVPYPTRWLDNDQYGHLNNSSYYLIADSIINSYLMQHCGIRPYLHPSSSSEPKQASTTSTTEPAGSENVIGLVVSSDATYFASTSFPSTLIVGLRVRKLGRSSVQYEVGLREKGDGEGEGSSKAAVVTHSTHVFVERNGRRPVKVMPTALREGLERLLVGRSAKL